MRSRHRSNNQHISHKPIKMKKNDGSHRLKLRKWKEEKTDHFLVKLDHTIKEKEKDLKRWQLKLWRKRDQ